MKNRIALASIALGLASALPAQKQTPPAPAPVKWTPSWVLPRWPGAIRVEMGPIEEGGARLRPVGVTARIHVNRYPIFEYGDY